MSRTRVLLVNASDPAHNLGLEKATAWWQSQGVETETWADAAPLLLNPFDVVWVSAIFSWHVPRLIRSALAALDMGKRVEVGGPGTFGLVDHIRRETGLTATARPDARFERQPGRYSRVFWSRGCPAKNCSLGFPRGGAVPICSVPEMEGWKFTLYHDVTPAPVILDNNLSALPRAHQEHIVERTLSAGFKTVDANSGFEPRPFRAATAALWNRLPLVAWRFAYDEIAERAAVLRMLETLDGIGVSRRRLHIYCLAGNEPIAACEQRVREIREWKCVPIVQARTPLDYLGGQLPVLHDWTSRSLKDFKRWGNWLSHSIPFVAYNPGLNHSGVKLRKALA